MIADNLVAVGAGGQLADRSRRACCVSAIGRRLASVRPAVGVAGRALLWPVHHRGPGDGVQPAVPRWSVSPARRWRPGAVAGQLTLRHALTWRYDELRGALVGLHAHGPVLPRRRGLGSGGATSAGRAGPSTAGC